MRTEKDFLTVSLSSYLIIFHEVLWVLHISCSTVYYGRAAVRQLDSLDPFVHPLPYTGTMTYRRTYRSQTYRSQTYGSQTYGSQKFTVFLIALHVLSITICFGEDVRSSNKTTEGKKWRPNEMYFDKCIISSWLCKEKRR